MTPIRRFIAMFACVCMSFCTTPVFAYSAAAQESSSKVQLSDAEMQSLVGANGSVDATMADYSVAGSTATAVLANRTSQYLSYTLDVVDLNGTVLETLAEGSLAGNEAIIVSGTPTVQNNKYVRARLWHPGLPGMESKDTSVAP